MNLLLQLSIFVRVFDLVFAKNVFDFAKVSTDPVGETKSLVGVKRDGQTVLKQDYTNFDDERKTQVSQKMTNDFSLFSTHLVNFEDTSIFTYYLRDNFDFIHNSKVFSDVLIFIPTDTAIKQLTAKPWEFPTIVDPNLSEKDQDRISRMNVLNFVQSHMVNLSAKKYKMPETNEDLHFRSFNGNEVSIKNDGAEFFVSSGDNWNRIADNKDEQYGKQTITFIIVEGVLDWPEKTKGVV